MPNFIEIEATYCDGQTYVRTYVGTDSTYTHTYARMDGHLKLSLLGRLCEEST